MKTIIKHMAKTILKILLLGIILIPFVCKGEDDEPLPPSTTILIPKTSQGKNKPFRYTAEIYNSENEICLITTYPYQYATVTLSHMEGDNYYSSIITPEEPCSSLWMEPGSSITVTFDSGLTLYGEY